MKYDLARVEVALGVLGKLKEPIDLPEGTIILSSRKGAMGTMLVLACLVPVKEEKE